MKPLARLKRRAFLLSQIYFISLSALCRGAFFFCRLTKPVGSGFQFPAAGWLRELCNKNPKRSHIWPPKTRIPVSAKTPIRELCTTPSPRARVRVRVVCPYGDINNIPLSVIPRACAHAREENGKPSEVLAQWRTKKFGGDFDPVRVAVDEAVSMFSSRQPEDIL